MYQSQLTTMWLLQLTIILSLHNIPTFIVYTFTQNIGTVMVELRTKWDLYIFITTIKRRSVYITEYSKVGELAVIYRKSTYMYKVTYDELDLIPYSKLCTTIYSIAYVSISTYAIREILFTWYCYSRYNIRIIQWSTLAHNTCSVLEIMCANIGNTLIQAKTKINLTRVVLNLRIE